MYSVIRVIQQTPGRHPTSNMILMGIIRVTTEEYWRVAAATAIALKILLSGDSTNTRLSAPPVMRMISKVKAITLVAEMVRSHKTRIADKVDAIESLVVVFDGCRMDRSM